MNKIEMNKHVDLGWTEVDSRMYLANDAIGYLELYHDVDFRRWILVDPQKKKRSKVKTVGILDYTNINKNMFKVSCSQIDNLYQGNSLMPSVYRTVMKTTGKIIRADNTQSRGGRSIWCSLASMDDVTVYTIKDNVPVILEADFDTGEPVSYDIEELYLTKYKMFACYSGNKK